MNKVELFNLPLHRDERGNLVSLEFSMLPFTPQRIYYLYDVTALRGGHAHRDEHELFVCIKGSFEAKIHDGNEWKTYLLDAPGQALYNSPMIWHQFENFSSDAVMLAVSSTPYDPDRKGYIMDNGL